MAKQAFPGVKTGGGPLAKLIGAAVVLALLVLVVKHPAEAAGWVKTAFTMFGDLVGALAVLFRELLG
jgi:hypothetical protein